MDARRRDFPSIIRGATRALHELRSAQEGGSPHVVVEGERLPPLCRLRVQPGRTPEDTRLNPQRYRLRKLIPHLHRHFHSVSAARP
jgi:hypothetical protein